MTINLNPRDFDTPYLLFALKTKMSLDGVTPRFNRDINYDRYSVELYKGTIKQSSWSIDKLQGIIDHWLENHFNECLLICKEFKIEGIPSTWVRDMIPTINISGYQTILDDGRLYVRLNPYKDYSSTYTSLNVKVVETLERMYEDGFVYGFDLPNWDLEHLDHELKR